MTSNWLKKPCEPGWQSKCFAETLKNVPSLRKRKKTNIRATGKQGNLKSVPYSIGISCNRVRGPTRM